MRCDQTRILLPECSLLVHELIDTGMYPRGWPYGNEILSLTYHDMKIIHITTKSVTNEHILWCDLNGVELISFFFYLHILRYHFDARCDYITDLEKFAWSRLISSADEINNNAR